MGDLGLIRLTTARTWGKATTFPLIVYSTPLREAHIQMTFCPMTPNGSLEIVKVGILVTLRGYNLVCRPLIGMRSEAKL